MLDDEAFKTEMQDFAESTTRESDPETIRQWMEANPTLPPESVPHRSPAQIAAEKAAVIHDYWKEVTAASGAGLVSADLDSARDALADALLNAGSSGSSLPDQLATLYEICIEWWSRVAFTTGNPIGPITADTEVDIVLPTPLDLAPWAAANLSEITMDEPAPGEKPIEPLVRANRDGAVQECTVIWIAFVREITTTHRGPDSQGVPTELSEQPVA